MLIPANQFASWQDLQDKVAMFFTEMGYDTQTPEVVVLAGRGKKEIDVSVRDPRASVNQLMLVECKLWESFVPQDTVHSFHTVMQGAGANTGFIISKRGFQSGAYEAAQQTNIHLLNWEELQLKFGRQWYLHRYEVIGQLVREMQMIDRIYLAQFEPGPIFNTMFYDATGRLSELYDLLAEIRCAIMAYAGAPGTFDAVGPFSVPVYESFPGATSDKYGMPVHVVSDVRAYFVWLENFAHTLLRSYQALDQQVRAGFDKLSDGGDEAFEQTLRLVREETPIRVFKEALGNELYNRLIDSKGQHVTRLDSGPRKSDGDPDSQNE